MVPPIELLLARGIGMELIYSFTIIVCSLMVYFGTKELYELSSYKGIKYFREAFLLFAIAYFFRSFIIFLIFLFDAHKILEISPMYFGAFALFMFMYFGSLAIFYLLYSSMWKEWNGKSKLILFHAIAVVISIVSVISRKDEVIMGINAFLFLFALFFVYRAYRNSKNKKKGKNLYAIYVLLFVFWILNIIDLLIPNFLQFFKLIIYLISIGLFLLILYKVLKKTGSD